MTTSSFYARHKYLWLALLGVVILLPYLILQTFSPDDLVRLGVEHPLLATLSTYGFWGGIGMVAYVAVKTKGGSGTL